MLQSKVQSLNPSEQARTGTLRSAFKKPMVCRRRLLAIACLLIPTLLSMATECEAAYFFRVLIGMVAFVIVSGLLPSIGSPAAIKKVAAGSDLPHTTTGASETRQLEDSSVVEIALETMEVCPEKLTPIIELTSSKTSTLFDISIKPDISSKPKDFSLEPKESRIVSRFVEDQVSNLLVQLEPTPSCCKITQELSALVQHSLDSIIPGAKATVFLAGPFWKSAPFVSSVPDIEMVISTSVAQRRAFLRKHWQKQQGEPPHASKGECLKWILRIVTKQMLKDRNFRWRRSSYCLPEAKVVLVAARLGTNDHLVAFDMSLNAGQPVRNALLLKEASDIHPSIKGLLQFVRRWAKVRGMAQASMGYLSLYAWTLLVLHFLQVSADVLAPAMCSEDSHGRALAAFEGSSPKSVPGVAELFEAFVRFYSQDFDWLYEEVSITTGRRSTSAYDDDAYPAEQRPKIRDPFQPNDDDLVTLVTATGMARLKEEFEIALTLMESEAPLTMLFQQWVPASEETSGYQ